MFTKSHYFDFDIITFKPGHFFSCGEANFRDFFPCILVQLGDFLRDKLDARGLRIPSLPPYEQYEFVFLMRMIPGNPLAVQNYALGLAGIPFVKYVVVSLPIQYVQIFGYVYLGEGFFTGGFSNMAIAVSFFVILAIVARMLDKRYGHKLRGKNGISKTER